MHNGGVIHFDGAMCFDGGHWWSHILMELCALMVKSYILMGSPWVS